MAHHHIAEQAASAADALRSRRTLRTLVWILIPIAIWTVAALVWLWPHNVAAHISQDNTSTIAVPGLTIPKGTVTAVTETNCDAVSGSANGDGSKCGNLTVRLDEGPEKGQSVAEFMREMPDRPTAKRRTIYLQPIGAFAGARGRILAATADYVERFFGLPVKTLPAVPLSQIPAEARRVHPSWGNEQILAPWVNNNLLYDKKPADAVAMLGLTDVDLYPEPSWNFVFGEAAPVCTK